MKQVLIQSGKVSVDDVPAPCVEAGTVLVRVDHSCVSVGTEMSGVRASGVPLWRRALREPENVKKALQMVSKQGFAHTRNEIRARATAISPTGYSAAGVVLEAGAGVDDMAPGDRVACAGSECAFHAEIIRVPRNLTAPIPESVSFEQASTVTLGAIALQSVRRAQPTLGETFVVIGLGILGQLTVQMLKANGCRVIGTDMDASRIEEALVAGMDAALDPDDGESVSRVEQLTSGHGADGAIITAASQSDAIVSSAFRFCRKKGRVVLVGDVGLDLKRSDIYAKELDFLVSTSYGPGRYDRRYEDEGLDYPLAYVRWTENRNMVEYLRLLADGKLGIDRSIESVYDLVDASDAYAALSTEGRRPLTVLLRYPADPAGPVITRRIVNPSARPARGERVRLALVGAGSYAKSMHLPLIQSLSDRIHLQAIASRSGHNAKATAERFGAGYATTDYDGLLEDAELDAVLIATRHDLHASMALRALEAGKHVLVEKPLALISEELAEIEGFFERPPDDGAAPVLMTGFNRRFSTRLREIRGLIRNRTNPVILNYRMNAGYVPLDHWVHSEEGGGRNRGEACHVYDVFRYLTGADVESVSASSLRPRTGYYSGKDNFVVTLRYRDGSVATLTYTALGATEYPKERFELFCDGTVIALDDYDRVEVTGARVPPFESKGVNKGQKAELIAFADVIQNGGEWPIPLSEQIDVAATAIRVEACLDEKDGGKVDGIE